jgi:hypothetical protein
LPKDFPLVVAAVSKSYSTDRSHPFEHEDVRDGMRARVPFPFDDDERFDLKLIPFFLDGLRISKLDEAQWTKLREPLVATLSPEGLRKVETIMSLEREVARLDRGSWTRWPLQFARDPKRYHVSLFGEPARYRPWGFRFDDNTLDGADHVHAIWRDFHDDFGEDLLARHYAQSHAHAGR